MKLFVQVPWPATFLPNAAIVNGDFKESCGLNHNSIEKSVLSSCLFNSVTFPLDCSLAIEEAPSLSIQAAVIPFPCTIPTTGLFELSVNMFCLHWDRSNEKDVSGSTTFASTDISQQQIKNSDIFCIPVAQYFIVYSQVHRYMAFCENRYLNLQQDWTDESQPQLFGG